MHTRFLVAIFATVFLLSCSPRDYLTRRLATDLISASHEFQNPQPFELQTGVVSNTNYISPEYIILQHHGWISATQATCTPGQGPPPCWDVLLTPSGVDTIRTVLPAEEAGKSALQIPAARRELIAVTGISKQGSAADVEFTWKWVPSNEIGAALYSGEIQYRSTVGFRRYDDGWRLIEGSPRSGQSIDDALKNAEPVP